MLLWAVNGPTKFGGPKARENVGGADAPRDPQAAQQHRLGGRSGRTDDCSACEGGLDEQVPPFRPLWGEGGSPVGDHRYGLRHLYRGDRGTCLED